MRSEKDEQGKAPSREAETRSAQRQFLLIGGLLVVMIAMLAFLWTRERRMRKQVEGELARTTIRQEALNQTLGNLLMRQVSGQAVRREDLPARRAQLDGEPVTLLQLSTAAGERLGFAPGDLIRVIPAPTTAPARTQPRTTAPVRTRPETAGSVRPDGP